MNTPFISQNQAEGASKFSGNSLDFSGPTAAATGIVGFTVIAPLVLILIVILAIVFSPNR